MCPRHAVTPSCFFKIVERIIDLISFVKDLADGVYTVKVDVLSGNGNISYEKSVKFAGKTIEKLSAKSTGLAKKLDAMEKKLSTDARFALLVKLGELKKAISSNLLSDAEKIADELAKEMK